MADASVVVLIKARDYTDRALDKAKQGFQRLGDTVRNMSMANIVALGGIAFAIGKVVDQASDLNESMNKANVVFGDAAESVRSFADVAATSIGATRQQAYEMTGTIGNLLVSFGLTSDKAADMSTKVVQLAADLGSFNNVPTDDALMAIRSALVGASEPMLRFGADTRQTRLEQVALEEGLIEAGETMDAQTRALAALEAIMRDTQTAHGDFARTADDLANKMKTTRAQFSDLTAELGTQLLPVVNEVLGVLQGAMALFNSLPKNLQNTAVGVGVLTMAFRALGVSLTGLGAALGPAGWAIVGVTLLATALYKTSENLTLTNEQLNTYNTYLDTATSKTEDWVEKLESASQAMAALPMYDIPETPHIAAEEELKKQTKEKQEQLDEQIAAVYEYTEEEKKAITAVTQWQQEQRAEMLIRLAEQEIEHQEKLGEQRLEKIQEQLEAENEARQASLEARQAFYEEYYMTDEQREIQSLANRLSAIDKYWSVNADLVKQFNEQADKIQQKYHDKEEQRVERQQQAYIQMQTQVAQGYAQMFGGLAAFTEQALGENKGITQAFLVAQAVMDTYAAANRAIGMMGPFGIPVAAGLIAYGMANVAQILSAARGAIVSPTADNLSYGTDVVPAMLTEGEAVIPRDTVRRNPTVVQQLLGSGDAEGATANNVTVAPVFNITAIDEQGVREFITGTQFRNSFVEAIQDGMIKLTTPEGKKIRGVS